MKRARSSAARGGLTAVTVLACAVAAAASAASGTSLAAGTPDGAAYAGEKRCRMCHFKKYKRWRKMRHARALNDLPENRKTAPHCVSCHVTAYGKPGGYVDQEKTPHLAGVQCEACHGPGSVHADAAKGDQPVERVRTLIRKSPGAVCIPCHNPHKTIEDYEREAELERLKARRAKPAVKPGLEAIKVDEAPAPRQPGEAEETGGPAPAPPEDERDAGSAPGPAGAGDAGRTDGGE